jgi:hypothetical protein
MRNLKMRVLSQSWPALLAFFILNPASAATQLDIPQIGPHEPILTFEKSENPQNVLIVYTEVDKDCHFRGPTASTGAPFVDYYWLMNRKTYKPVNPMIKNGIRDRLAIEKSKNANPDSFTVKIEDLADLKTDLKDPRMTVKTAHEGKDCAVEALVTLGGSDHDRVLRLKTISTVSEKTLIPPFRKIKSLSLEGKDVKTGEDFKRTYTAHL